MMAKPTPYIEKKQGDLIHADDWNQLQVRAREDLQSHNHTGTAQGVRIAGQGIAEGSITAAHLAADLTKTLSHLASQEDIRTHLQSHNHTGHEQGARIAGQGIADGSITLSHLAADLAIPSAHLAKDLTVGSLRIDRDLFVQGLGSFAGKVGIGTAAPDTPLHVSSGSQANLSNGTGALVIGAITGTNLVMDTHAIMARRPGGASTLSLQGHGGDLRVHADQDAATQVIITDSGNVGMGTVAPRTRLEVHGDVRLGQDGNCYALAALQNMHVIVGKVDKQGAKVWGEGFQSCKTETGQYRIDFDEHFAVAPVVIAGCTDTNMTRRETLGCEHITVAGFEVHLWRNTNNRPEDDPFDFIALGPRISSEA